MNGWNPNMELFIKEVSFWGVSSCIFRFQPLVLCGGVLCAFELFGDPLTVSDFVLSDEHINSLANEGLGCHPRSLKK